MIKQLNSSRHPDSEISENKYLKDNLSENRSNGTALSITVLSDNASWLNPWIDNLLLEIGKQGHQYIWIHDPEEVPEGDLCFILSCSKMVKAMILERNTHNLVVHESNLPQGKGWSPMTWQVLEGKDEIPVTLFEAVEKTDSGPIYLKDIMKLDGHELVEELRVKQARVTLDLCRTFIRNYPEVLEQVMPQSGEESFYAKRKPYDSRLDPNKSIADQFNLLRVVDNEVYPAFFEWKGHRYVIKIEKEKQG